MNPTAVRWFRLAAVLAGLSVVTGAFAAHGLEKPLLDLYSGKTRMVMGEEIPAAQKYMRDFETAAEYQMTHALGLLALALLPGPWTRQRGAAAWFFVLGILLFSGSLYVLVLTGITKLGMVTPFGGVCFLIAWTLTALAAKSSLVPAAASARG